MYICRSCESVFDDPRLVVEKHGLHCAPYETFSCCPMCGCDFVPLPQCDGCGSYITGDYVELNNGEVYCTECYEIKNILD